MTTDRRAVPLALAAVVLLLVGACSGSERGTADPLQSALEQTAPPSTDPLPTDAATTPAPPASIAPTEPVVDVSQTDTAWGRIWDAVPPGFPVFPGAQPSEEAGGGEPVSATFTAGSADPTEIATWFQSELELATYSTEALSGPLEDGSFVLDSVGDGDCRIETTVKPAGGLTTITVRFGAACPFE